MPRDLALIVTDLYLAPDSASMESPGLEALELLMARAGRREKRDWREWICGVAGFQHAPAVAPVSRCADQLPRAGQWWLASPVHLEAGLDHVRLARQLTLAPDEWLELEAAIPRVLDPVLGYEGSSGANAYLLAPREIQARTVDPARAVGSDVHAFLPAGRDAALLKRVMTELQMWLHSHPLNMRREQRGLLPVNALWIWGGGTLPERVAAEVSRTELPALFSDDAFATGLWRLAGGSPRALPAELDRAAMLRAPSSIVAVTLRQRAGDSDGERMRVLDQAWIVPALALLRSRDISRLRMHFNDSSFTVTPFDLLRVWRRRRPWLEAAG
jgi:hypothetical protein